MTLSIYLDKTGKALVSGYVENPKGLHFLNASQYRYENETNQLYALTNALTRKDGEVWTLKLGSSGNYRDYRSTFYLPNDIKVKNLSCSQGLGYLLSISNDSMIVEFLGYDVKDPSLKMEYQQPLETSAPLTKRPSYLPALILIPILAAFAAFGWRYRTRRSREASLSITDAKASSLGGDNSQPNDKHISFESEETSDKKDAMDESIGQEKSVKSKELEESIATAAIMETLTPRERTIIEILIDRGGRVTQADLRYATNMPKSSLADILSALERRKLVTKREWRRTNVIELSEWVLSKEGRS